MKDLSIVRVRAGIIEPKLLESWAKLYCAIWKDPPWNEDFWRPEQVAEDFCREMLNPDAVAYLALESGHVVGFTHGYSVFRDDLRKIAGNTLLDFLFEKNERIFYVDELGVAGTHRGRKISLELTSPLIDHVRKCGIRSITLRTDVEAVAARHLYQRLGFSELEVHDAGHPSRTYWLLELFFHNL